MTKVVSIDNTSISFNVGQQWISLLQRTIAAVTSCTGLSAPVVAMSTAGVDPPPIASSTMAGTNQAPFVER
jgi:hypothetical protein